ncbi:basic leucine zipper 61-like [Macadamia integrifolia]|uniref:basic leucine zipper 61-like n=1 Tax=Macadamia integrifolia TaxID=60698 RepID=UPI001C528EE0|nr:basic leucine zipper 61-like [Macadamia integrifolia]
MAQLPPKIPNLTPNWPNFSHLRIHSMGSLMPTITTTQQPPPQPSQQPSWVEEFLDFSSAKRGSHRRSASDSIAFLEAPVIEECRNSSASLRPNNNNNDQFDGLDDEQLMSMFSDDISTSPNLPPTTVSSSNPSTPSDHNSINEDKKPTPSDQHLKNESAEVQSSCNADDPPHPTSANGDTIVDPRRVKRILANRQSAQRSRVRKLQYISELERSVTSLQTEVSTLSPRVAFLDHQRLVLNVDNGTLKQRIAALAQDKIFKDAHQDALRKEIERLRQVYHQQNLKKVGNNNTLIISTSTAPTSDTHPAGTDNEHPMN